MSALLKRYIAHGVVFLCAALMLFAFVGLQPWDAVTAVGGFTPPPGVELPDGFQPPANFTPPPNFQPPAGFSVDGAVPSQRVARGAFFNPAMLLVPAAALIASALTAWSIFMPRFNKLASYLTVGAGLLGLAYFALMFTRSSGSSLGQGIALAGTVGLLAQVFIPRPSSVQAGIPPVTSAVAQPTSSAVEAAPTRIISNGAAKIARKGSSLNLMQNLGVAFDALIANKLRSALTMLGVIIGVMSIVSLLSIGQGAQTSVTEQISSTGLNLLTISPSRNAQTLTYQDALALEDELTGIDYVLPSFNQSLTVRSDNDNFVTTVLGVTEDHADGTNLTLQIGRFISAEDYGGNARVAVLGTSAVEELFGGLNPVGRNIRVGSQRFVVIGVLDQQDSGFGNDPNLNVYIPLSTGYRNLFNARTAGTTDQRVNSIRVAVTELDDVPARKAQVESILNERHRIAAGEDSDFTVLDQSTLLNTAENITGIFTVLLGAIAGVSLVVGGIGIMNISLVSVTERTKEIGLRKAIGARSSNILQQFLIETTFLSTLGGAIGVLLGVGIALLVNGSGLLTATITLDSILLGLGFSVLIGVFFGVYPASRAAALPPIEALRYE